MKYSKLWALLVAVSLSAPVWASETVRCTHCEMPSYPVLLRGLKIGGHVKLKLTVSPEGKVQKAVVEGGNPMLAEISCIAAKKWTFSQGKESSLVPVVLVFDPKSAEPSILNELETK
jgi:outer membrane biosynthesis protein TonB